LDDSFLPFPFGDFFGVLVDGAGFFELLLPRGLEDDGTLFDLPLSCIKKKSK
jgi:hypothetical protein